MKEQRDLPLVKIGEGEFIVDVALGALRERDNPGNRVSFMDLEIDGGKYALYFEPGSKAIDYREREGFEKIPIRQMVSLDPEGICAKHGLSKEQLPATDSELKSDPLLLRQRIDKGMLPRVGIAGKEYFVDVRMEELRDVDAHWKRIDLNVQDVNEFDNYVFFYDTQKHEVITIDPSITEEPENAVLVELPNEVILDPVGVGRKLSGNEMQFVESFPLQHNLQARIFPLSQTVLPAIIADNKLKKPLLDAKAREANKKGKGKGNRM